MKKKLKIGILVGENIDKYSNYGFTMRIGWQIEGLKKLGHDVFLYALDKSNSSNLVKCYPQNIDLQERHKKNLISLKAVQDSNKLDILHSHSYSGVTMSPLSKCPVVYTVAYVNFEKTIINLYKLFPNVHFVPMSNFLKKQFKLNWTNVVHNGINAGKFVLPKKENRNMFICIGRIVPEKGIHIATKYCSDKNIKLKIAGPISDQEYFTKKIKPFLGKYVSYVGELNFKEKIKFYQEAKALLNPLQYNEAFGNTMIEAMACGTPIIAFNKGSVPEVVKDQKTGFIVNNIKELGLKINKISEINSLDCRSRVLDNFTYQKMAENYEEIYYKILRQKK